MYFFALSHAPPVFEAEMATYEEKHKIENLLYSKDSLEIIRDEYPEKFLK